jgi:hypothetical protein
MPPRRARRAASVVFLAGGLLSGCWLAHPLGSPVEPTLDAGSTAVDAFHFGLDSSFLDSSIGDASRNDASEPVDASRPDARRSLGCVDGPDQTIRPTLDEVYEHVAAIDLDGDGASELVALGRGGDDGASLSLFRLIGGELTEEWRASGEGHDYGYPRAVLGTDIDADGDLDVVASMNGLRVFVNDSGTLALRGLASPSPTSSGVEADDLDGDGDTDIVAGGDEFADGAVHIATQSDAGTFRETIVGGPPDYSFAQMLHRGGVFPQLVVIAGDVSQVFGVYEEVGTEWRSVMSGETPDRLSGLAAADFDGDGLEDFVVTRSHGLGPVFYRHRPGSVFPLAMEGNPAIGWAWANTVHDIDSDGDPDLLIGAFSGTLWLYESTGGFSFAEHATSCSFTRGEITALYSITAGDFDADGLRDIAIGTNAGIIVFLDAGHRLFGM